MTFRALLKQLLPPILVNTWRRFRPRSPVAVKVVHEPDEHTVQAGPLQGRSLFVAAGMPAYRDMLSGAYDTYVFEELAAVHTPEGLLLDVGAHIGYHSLCFAALYPLSGVIAFEPNPANLERARRNFRLSPDLAARIELKGSALSETNGTTVMNGSSNVEDQTSSGSYIEGASKPLQDEVYRKSGFMPFEVPTRRLDDLMVKESWGRVSIVKLDVEGAEHLVLKGGTALLQRDRPRLIIEVHSVVCMLEVLNLIIPLGYHARVIHEDRPGRCFIAARHGMG